jgi:hypothetical protein
MRSPEILSTPASDSRASDRWSVCREPVEQEFGGRVDDLVEVPSGTGVMERVSGAFVLQHYAVIASLHHHVPEPSYRADRRNLVVPPVLNQRGRISGPDKLDRRVVSQPAGGNAGDLLFKGLLFRWRVGEQIDDRIQGHDRGDARLRRRKRPRATPAAGHAGLIRQLIRYAERRRGT